MYRVIKYFTDLHDKNHPYNVGDIFPREGIAVTEERLAELAGSENRQKTPLIELVEEEVANETVEEAVTDETEQVPAKKTSAKKTTVKKTEAKTPEE